ncbi:hypothetical protein BC941DRAFT_457673 [Chlamydoabsidia padenii]|nr:hypothetical protein BC941DRAFT_457673 [Chlamydoabsidia padenii]
MGNGQWSVDDDYSDFIGYHKSCQTYEGCSTPSEKPGSENDAIEFPNVSPDSPEPPITEEVTSDSKSVVSGAVSYLGDISDEEEQSCWNWNEPNVDHSEEDHDADQINFFINRFDAVEDMTNDTECIAEEDVEHFARDLGGAHPFLDIQSMVLSSIHQWGRRCDLGKAIKEDFIRDQHFDDGQGSIY